MNHRCKEQVVSTNFQLLTTYQIRIIYNLLQQKINRQSSDSSVQAVQPRVIRNKSKTDKPQQNGRVIFSCFEHVRCRKPSVKRRYGHYPIGRSYGRSVNRRKRGNAEISGWAERSFSYHRKREKERHGRHTVANYVDRFHGGHLLNVGRRLTG